MHQWLGFLQALPTVHQRLIARSQRISLPRGANADVRLERLRQALCHAATVRATFAMLSEDERAALFDLRGRRRGLSTAELYARYGGIRPLRQLAADPTPRSIAERLLLLGWLFERRDALGRPSRWLLPHELRGWLPAPLTPATDGLAPAPPTAPIVRAAQTVLHACAAHPLPVRADGGLRRASVRMLVERLAPLDGEEAAALLLFTLPLLISQGLVACYNGRCELAPAARRFLTQPEQVQRDHLLAAWQALPAPDRWLQRLLRTSHGIDWPLLRRRLCAWAGALPAGQLLDPACLGSALTASLGPLADAQTHGYRRVARAPWSAERAETIWQAALRGPLAWLGLVAWEATAGSARVFRPHAYPSVPPPAWSFGEPGCVCVPHGSAADRVLDLLPFAEWRAAGCAGTTYCISAQTLARAIGAGHHIAGLRALLTSQAGPIPPEWETLLEERRPPLRVVRADMLIAEQPAVLSRAARQASVQRALKARLAPGIALVQPARTSRLTRALARQGLAVADAPTDEPPAQPDELSPAQCATLLEACAVLRRAEAANTAPLALDQIETVLRARLTPALRAAARQPGEDVALPPAEPAGAALPIAAALAQLRAAIKARRPIEIAYDTAEQGQPAWRSVRPTLIERHGDTWLLRAYCQARQAERTFRVDRIVATR